MPYAGSIRPAPHYATPCRHLLPITLSPLLLLLQLAALRDVYLLGSPLLQPFVSFLLRRISTTSGGGATGMDRLSEFELNACLQDSLAAGGMTQLLRISAQLLPVASGSSRPGGGGHPEQRVAAAAGGGGVRLVQQLSRLRLRVEPGWPLSLVVGEEMLEQYNAVLVLLLQVREAVRRASALL